MAEFVKSLFCKSVTERAGDEVMQAGVRRGLAWRTRETYGGSELASAADQATLCFSDGF